MRQRSPVLFFGHGNPLNAISDNAYTSAWREIGLSLVKPKAVLCISAHWYVPFTGVTSMLKPRTIHDFGGFPKELFDVSYAAPGSPALAKRVQELIGPDVVLDEDIWGLDHGTWSVLCHVFPNADIPIVQLSLNRLEPSSFHYSLAKKLAPLRDEDILIVGSGNVVHNLRAYSWDIEFREPYDWALRFETMIRRSILTDDHRSIINYDSLGKDASMSVPTPDHFLPLLYILALKNDGDEINFPVGGFDGGSISMTSIKIG